MPRQRVIYRLKAPWHAARRPSRLQPCLQVHRLHAWRRRRRCLCPKLDCHHLFDLERPKTLTRSEPPAAGLWQLYLVDLRLGACATTPAILHAPQCWLSLRVLAAADHAWWRNSNVAGPATATPAAWYRRMDPPIAIREASTRRPLHASRDGSSTVLMTGSMHEHAPRPATPGLHPSRACPPCQHAFFDSKHDCLRVLGHPRL